MAKNIFMSAYDEKSQPSTDVIAINGLSFKYDKPFFLICNYPIQDKAYFEFYIDDYYPIKAFRNIPLYVGISKEVSFGVLNSDFIIGSLYYNAETTQYDIMSKYSRQYLNYHTQPEHIYTRLPGAKDIIGVGVDYTENCINIFVNGKLFYKIQNNTYDEDGNVLTSFDLTSGTFFFCIWSNVYYKKVLSDFNENSNDTFLEQSKEINGCINFGGSQESGFMPSGYKSMYSIYAEHITPPDPEDEEIDPSDSYIIDSSQYENMKMISEYLGDDNDCTFNLTSTIPIDATIKTMAITHYPDIDPITQQPIDDGIEIIDRFKYTMKACVDPDEKYFLNGSTIFVNKPIPTDKPVYFEFYVTEGQIKNNKIGIPISIGITGYQTEILSKSSRLDLYHDPWYHYYWREMNNTSIDPDTYIQHLHEIDDVLITTPPEQGQVIGVAFNLKHNKMTVYIDNTKFYTMYTNRVTDRESGEIFTISKDELNYLIFTGNKGTIYTQTRYNPSIEYTHHFICNNGINYDGYYNSHSGRFELFEENSIFIMEKVPEEYNYYNLNGVIYTKIDIGYGSYVEFIGSNDIRYTQIKSDVMIRSVDGVMFEFRIKENGDYKFYKVNTNRQLIYSDLDYSNSWNFTYAFIHDEGAFNGTIKGSFNFGQENFASTMPEGYISLWEYYSTSSKINILKDISSRISIINNNNLYINLLSLVKIINTGSDYPYKNKGSNKMILNHNFIHDEEEPYYVINGADMAEFTSMIARENNGYLPEEKTNSTTITFEGVVHYTITIPSLDNQYIEVFLNSRNKYTTTFQAPKGSFVNAKIVPEFGYTAGTLNIDKFTVTEDVILTATPAKLTNYVINILNTKNQYIEVWKIDNFDEDGNIILSDVMYDSRVTNRFTTTMIDSLWYVKVIADFGYIAGKPNYTILNVTKDVTISAEDARIESYIVTIPNTVHQIVGVRFNNTKYYSRKIDVANIDSTLPPITFEVPYNTRLYITSEEVDIGYKIEGEFDTYIDIFRDTIIEVPNIVDDMCTIEVDDSLFDGTYIISNSTKDGNIYTIRKGTKCTITLNPSDGLYTKTFILE